MPHLRFMMEVRPPIEGAELDPFLGALTTDPRPILALPPPGGGTAVSTPAGSGPTGSTPAGSGPTGSMPAGSGPAGSTPAGSGEAQGQLGGQSSSQSLLPSWARLYASPKDSSGELFHVERSPHYAASDFQNVRMHSQQFFSLGSSSSSSSSSGAAQQQLPGGCLPLRFDVVVDEVLEWGRPSFDGVYRVVSPPSVSPKP